MKRIGSQVVVYLAMALLAAVPFQSCEPPASPPPTDGENVYPPIDVFYEYQADLDGNMCRNGVCELLCWDGDCSGDEELARWLARDCLTASSYHRWSVVFDNGYFVTYEGRDFVGNGYQHYYKFYSATVPSDPGYGGVPYVDGRTLTISC